MERLNIVCPGFRLRSVGRFVLAAAALPVFLVLSREALTLAGAQALVDRGRTALEEGRTPAAVNSFLRAETLVPGMGPSRRGLGEAYLRLYRQNGDPLLLYRAREWFGMAAAVSPADLHSLMLWCRIGVLEGAADPVEVVRCFDLAAGLSDGHPLDPFLRRSFLELALDAAVLPSKAGVKLRRDSRMRSVVSAAGFLASRGEIRLEDLAPLVEGGLLEADDLIRIPGVAEAAILPAVPGKRP